MWDAVSDLRIHVDSQRPFLNYPKENETDKDHSGARRSGIEQCGAPKNAAERPRHT